MSHRPASPPPPDERSRFIQELFQVLGPDHLEALGRNIQHVVDLAAALAMGEEDLLRACALWRQEVREAEASGLATNRALEAHVAPKKGRLLKLRRGPTVETLEP